MSDKPKMYKGNINHELNNNLSIYASYNDKSSIKVFDSSTVRRKIDDIFNSDNFIYRTRVNIVLDGEILSRKVIGVYNNNLVTIDNEQIPISMIKDIYK